jgi:hypothetical protein
MTMPLKRLIDPRRMRKGLPRGFGWIDHRLLRDGYLSHCSPQALSLYVFLVCASDAQGLSYYSGPRIAQLLSLEPTALSEARRELIELGLIAYQKPLYQLLSLEGELQEHKSQPPRRSAPDCEPQAVGTVVGLSLKAMVESLIQKQGAQE